ncbi:MAG: 30S ribosomal protein S5 [Candidatus Doudnabacteria bacterium RIFCSPHIGHO2_01_52_17]|uniref:Small ribosomal subunit protein uS5 n=1 Tax=Candidatus Doudnabacteria bacterium RIFCSPHIGHO2_01_52_17 TaxID=1817820 RepID=A0A1F5N925_9BACT|nr:MAG: 30S ribosomal protein S5 [Candidatus Doudnabacteria bacterium RIFCSPHIGHO2_01_52_17]
MAYREHIKREFDSKVVEVRRVTRVVAGGKRMRFRALVVVGDRKGRVGMGLKKGVDVADAIGKATNAANKSMIEVPIKDGTIPHIINFKYKAAKILLKPARPGTGIIAGGPLRAVLTLSGIRNITSKMLGSSNKVSNVRAVYLALQQFNRGGRN